jgi:hypothetical protein
MNWTKTPNVAQYGGASWSNWVATKNFSTVAAAQAFAAKDPKITFFFYARQNMVLGNGRSFKPGDAAFFSGQPWFGSAPQCDSYQKFIYMTPAFVRDFPAGSPEDVAVCAQWDTNITGFTAQAIIGNPWNTLYASNQTSYFDSKATPLPLSAAAAIVTWTAFPNRLNQYLGQQTTPANPYNYSANQLLALADRFAAGGVALPDFQQIPTVLCPQADWSQPLHMYGPYGPRGWQDEYCEWSVVRDSTSNKIIRIDFTCENPEYWNTLWLVDPQKVADLYSSTLSWDAPAGQQVTVPVTDLYLTDPKTGKVVIDPSTKRPAYNPLNKWNTGPIALRGKGTVRGGAMHLTSTPNTIQTEMQLAGGATVQRKIGNSQPQPLICCAQYGQAYRNSDPHIGQSVNQVVGGQFTGSPCQVALANPNGLYIQVPDLSGFTLPNDPKLPSGATAQDCWQIVRGSEQLTDPVTGLPFGATPGSPQTTGNFVLHAVFQIPSAWIKAGAKFAIGDIKDANGNPILWGGQITQQMNIGIWARPLPVANAPAAQPCVDSPAPSATYAQALQLFHQAVWNAFYNTSVSNPMNNPISLASNSTLIAPLVKQGANGVRMCLTCATAQVTNKQLPVVDLGPGITVKSVSFDPNINYAVPGNSYPSPCGMLTIDVSVSPTAALGLRGVVLTNYGQPVQPAMPGLLNIVAP